MFGVVSARRPSPFSAIRPARSRFLAMPRLGDGDSYTSISYAASTCNQRNSAGMCIADVFLDDPTNPLPSDPGSGPAVAADAAEQAAQSALKALQQSAGVPSPSFAIAESLFSGDIPSPLPGLGIKTGIPDALKKLCAQSPSFSWLCKIPTWALVVGVGVVGVAVLKKDK